ncbi:amino acid ABC transporter substrate-binding protein [Acaryochloris sp. IP29b_bin.148]|uniref:amino acid ABC transporter substrate-binding protein n=1 Tax=Acaryochloris sp. IP29b_bin.148 TaxID=2969218 RepID=UPI00261F6913|nr:amino acid ABC transporter substrate-binding protein [Acaryochloris sp. IP29b_bin.148]
MIKPFSLLCASLLCASVLASCSNSSQPGASNSTNAEGRLLKVLNQKKVRCGISGELPGFSFVDDQGNYSGLDVDICRAIAAALFDDPNAVEYRPLNAKERFTAVQTGEVDVLSRNTTWTLERDSSVRMAFAPVVFYDGQGIMVKANSGIKTLKDFQNRAICTQTGTTNEKNLADQMRKLKVAYKSVVYDDINAAYAAYIEGRCDGVTSDRSQLVSRRTSLPDPESHTILDEVMSKEPLAPAVVDGDSQWVDVVRWVVNATIEAEELGIEQGNLASFANSDDPVIQRFLGKKDELGKSLGLSPDFAARVVKHVGNYGEIYNRNLGPKTGLNLPRGQNQLWTQGGLLYSPPFR